MRRLIIVEKISFQGLSEDVDGDGWESVQDLVLYMLEADQFVRGSAVDMIEHPWITVSTVLVLNHVRQRKL